MNERTKSISHWGTLIFTLCLAVILMICATVTVSADETDGANAISVTIGDQVSYHDDIVEAFNTANAGKEQSPATVKLLIDVTHTTWNSLFVNNGAHIVLDLNGHALTLTNSDANIYVTRASHFTLMDSSVDKDGILSTCYNNGAVSVNGGSTMILHSGCVVNDVTNDKVTIKLNESTLIQNGGVIVGKGFAVAVLLDDSSSFTQNGGIINISYSGVEVDGGSSYVLEDGSLIIDSNINGSFFRSFGSGSYTINGGTMSKNLGTNQDYHIADLYGSSELTINGGTFPKVENAVLNTGHLADSVKVQLKGGDFEAGLKLYNDKK